MNAVKKIGHTEAVQGRWRCCGNCLVSWLVCMSCSSSRRYCSKECSQSARQRSRRASVQKYSRTENGKESQRIRQRKYRLSLKKTASVTDQSQSAQLIQIRIISPNHQSPVVHSSPGSCRLCKRGPLFLASTSRGQQYQDPYPCHSLEKLFQGFLREHLVL
jgi:hypothetical protein